MMKHTRDILDDDYTIIEKEPTANYSIIFLVVAVSALVIYGIWYYTPFLHKWLSGFSWFLGVVCSQAVLYFATQFLRKNYMPRKGMWSIGVVFGIMFAFLALVFYPMINHDVGWFAFIFLGGGVAGLTALFTTWLILAIGNISEEVE